MLMTNPNDDLTQLMKSLPMTELMTTTQKTLLADWMKFKSNYSSTDVTNLHWRELFQLAVLTGVTLYGQLSNGRLVCQAKLKRHQKRKLQTQHDQREAQREGSCANIETSKR